MFDFRILIFLVTVGLGLPGAYSSIDHPEWKNYKDEHGKTYETLEEEMWRNEIFFKNLKKVEEHNRRYDQGLETYKMRMNGMGDMTEEEFLEMMTSRRSKYGPKAFSEQANCTVPSSGLQAEVDWRPSGAITGVKNQGSCGSCWAFSTTGSLEFLSYLENVGQPVEPLSEQNLVDCSRPENKGCQGGWPGRALEYVSRYGINTEKDYPYTSHTGKEGTCHFNSQKLLFKGIKTYEVPKSEAALKCVLNKRAVSVAIYATTKMQLYGEGVFSDSSCSNTRVNHGVLAVGYGTENGSDYWLIKNSWGTKWGENGYIKIARNKNNHCCIACHAVYPSY